eukprot:PhM_4_TR16184/c0_g1_i1/m.14100
MSPSTADGMTTTIVHSRTCATFELNMMRLVRQASLGAAVGPVVHGLNIFFTSPTMALGVVQNVVILESVFVPIVFLLHYDIEELNSIDDFRPYIVPATLILALGTYGVTYALAVSSGHAVAFWPFIANLGATAPESVVYQLGYMFSTTCYALLVNIVSKQKFHSHEAGKLKVAPYLTTFEAVAFGYTSVIGLLMTAAFPAYYFGMFIFYASAFPFLMLVAPPASWLVVEEEEAQNVDALHETVRKVAFVAGGVSTALYPVFTHFYPIAGALCETVAGASWATLLYSSAGDIASGPAVEELELTEEIILSAPPEFGRRR